MSHPVTGNWHLQRPRLIQSQCQWSCCSPGCWRERWKTVGVIFHLIDPITAWSDLLVISKPEPIWPSLVWDSPSRKWTESVAQFSTGTDTKTQSLRVWVTMWWGGWRWSGAWRMWTRTSQTRVLSDTNPRKLLQSSSEVSLGSEDWLGVYRVKSQMSDLIWLRSASSKNQQVSNFQFHFES